jgi:type IV secretion system protein TrbL
MGGIGVIDRFLEVFTRYIDSGFGLLRGEITFLSSTLIAIDITLAGLFWALAADEDVLARLIRKTLYIGLFAFLIGNFNGLARIVFESFAGLGLKASGSAIGQAEFLQPGRLARVGLDAGRPILQAAGELMGFVSFFDNFIQIFVLLIAWLVVLVAFFLLAVQLFVTLIEFKITTLAGFVLIPFGLFSKTSFLAEKVLGNVVASGVKVLVLAVIVGIGTGLFGEFTRGFGEAQPTIEDALALVLAALSLLGLGLFGPGIATGLVSGAPQLGAGAAAGTALAAGGLAVAGGMAATGAVSTAARLGAAGGRFTGTLAVERQITRRTELAREIRALGGGRASPGSGGSTAPPPTSPPSGPAGGVPGWAQRLKHSEAARHGVSAAIHTVRSSDHGGGSAAVPLAEEDRQ